LKEFCEIGRNWGNLRKLGKFEEIGEKMGKLGEIEGSLINWENWKELG
jgi:hypothetical protein